MSFPALAHLPSTASALLRVGLLTVVLAAAGCGEDDPTGPDPALQALVGDWTAVELTLTNVANPSVVADLIEVGATFDLNVQPSGQYTAILILNLQSQTEVGQVELSGSQITLRPTVPADAEPTTGTFALQGEGFVLDGLTEFDFNSDGTPEPAEVRFRFVPD